MLHAMRPHLDAASPRAHRIPLAGITQQAARRTRSTRHEACSQCRLVVHTRRSIRHEACSALSRVFHSFSLRLAVNVDVPSRTPSGAVTGAAASFGFQFGLTLRGE